MDSNININKATLIAITLLLSTTAFAQHRHHGHVRPYIYRPAVVRVANRPAVTTLFDLKKFMCMTSSKAIDAAAAITLRIKM